MNESKPPRRGGARRWHNNNRGRSTLPNGMDNGDPGRQLDEDGSPSRGQRGRGGYNDYRGNRRHFGNASIGDSISSGGTSGHGAKKKGRNTKPRAAPTSSLFSDFDDDDDDDGVVLRNPRGPKPPTPPPGMYGMPLKTEAINVYSSPRLSKVTFVEKASQQNTQPPAAHIRRPQYNTQPPAAHIRRPEHAPKPETDSQSGSPGYPGLFLAAAPVVDLNNNNGSAKPNATPSSSGDYKNSTVYGRIYPNRQQNNHSNPCDYRRLGGYGNRGCSGGFAQNIVPQSVPRQCEQH